MDAAAPGQVPLKNPDMERLGLSAGDFLSLYGWPLLAVSFAVFLLVQQLRKRRSSRTHEDPQVQQDASLVTRRQEAMEAARRRMQEELDAKAAMFKEKQRQVEEEKRRQKIEDWENLKQGRSGRGHTLAETPEEAGPPPAAPRPRTDRKPLRSDDYSPLTGQGGSCSWRPGRRAPSAGG